jgi:hypothetical protein
MTLRCGWSGHEDPHILEVRADRRLKHINSLLVYRAMNRGYQSSKLALWDLGIVLETLPGDAVLFLGRIITHNTVDIQGGARNMANCFVHEAPLSWGDSMQKELTSFDRVGYTRKRKLYAKYTKAMLRTETTSSIETGPSRNKKQKENKQQDNQKGKGKQQDTDEAGNTEIATGTGDLDTDEEMETMYALRLGEEIEEQCTDP